MTGSNVVQFFNTLSNGTGIIDYQSFVTNAGETTLPVNYIGTNEPANSNLYYCDFVLTNPPAYNTNLLPTVSVTSPSAGEIFTNGASIVIDGVAGTNQWTGLARIRVDMNPQSGIYQGQPFGDDVIGTTNWYLPVSSQFGTIPPGEYKIRAVSQDGYGILGVPDTSKSFTVVASLVIATNGVGTTSISPAPVNISGTYLYAGTNYTLSAIPGAGQTFYTWSSGGNESINPNLTISGNYNQTWTVTFIPTNLPARLGYYHSGFVGQTEYYQRPCDLCWKRSFRNIRHTIDLPDFFKLRGCRRPANGHGQWHKLVADCL